VYSQIPNHNCCNGQIPFPGYISPSEIAFATAATAITTAPLEAIATANYLVYVIFHLKNSFNNSSNRDCNGKLTAAVTNYQRPLQRLNTLSW